MTFISEKDVVAIGNNCYSFGMFFVIIFLLLVTLLASWSLSAQLALVLFYLVFLGALYNSCLNHWIRQAKEGNQ